MERNKIKILLLTHTLKCLGRTILLLRPRKKGLQSLFIQCACAAMEAPPLNFIVVEAAVYWSLYVSI